MRGVMNRLSLRERVGRAAPGDGHLAVGGVEAAGGLLERAVLHHEPAAENGRQDGGPGDDADGDEGEARPAAPEAQRREPKRVGEPAERARHQYG